MKAGDVISIPPYGSATLCYYRELDCTYVLDLSFGKLYAHRDTIIRSNSATEATTSTTAKVMPNITTIKLNAAYEALEKMRILNLEVMCQERGIPFYCLEVNSPHQQCTTCLLSMAPPAKQQQQSSSSSSSSSIPQKSVRRFPRFFGTAKESTPAAAAAAAAATPVDEERPENNNSNADFGFTRWNGFVKIHQNQNNTTTTTSYKYKIQKGIPCLLCGSPVCSNHASKMFQQTQANINVCLSCEDIFGMEHFVLDCLTLDKLERRQRVDRLLDSYDRTLLLLQYSRQFIQDIVSSLEDATVFQNVLVGVGSSSIGIVSGVLGIAAAATILTPVGPSLLLASLLFGTGATAVQTGSHVKNRYFTSQPDQLADRIIALHSMLQTMIRIISILRDALLSDDSCRSKIMMQLQQENAGTKFTDFLNKTFETSKSGILAGYTVGQLSMAGMEIGGQLVTTAEVGSTIASNGAAQVFSVSNLLRTARLARFAGGALSAATLILETKCLTHTIVNIRAGNPCEKAQQLRAVCAQLDNFPSSSSLEVECERYLQAMNQRERRITQEEAVRLLLETSTLPSPYSVEEESSPGVLDNEDDEQIIFSYNDDNDDVESVLGANITTTTSSNTSIAGTFRTNDKMQMSASLLERIERFKRQQDTMASKDTSRTVSTRKTFKKSTSSASSSSSSSSSSSDTALSSPTAAAASVSKKFQPLPSSDDSCNSTAGSLSSSQSLLQRIEMFKLRQATGGGGQQEHDVCYPVPQADCEAVLMNIV